MIDLREALAHQLRVARELAGLSPEDASDKVNGDISGSYIRRLEKGIHAPTVEAVAMLCAAYGTTLSKFFGALAFDEPRKPRELTGARR